jgi:intracellular multiplication protein IcmP
MTMQPQQGGGRSSWPSSDDTALFNLIVILLGVGVGAYLLWMNYHAQISSGVMAFVHQEIGWLGQITNRFRLADQQMMNSDPSGVTLADLYGILHATGAYVRIPAAAFIAILGIFCSVFAAPSRFRRAFDVEGLLREQALRFPAARAFVRRKLGLVRLDEKAPRPADYALTAGEWLDRFVCKTGEPFDDGRAFDALAVQLGPTWKGSASGTPIVRVLFAAFALHMVERRDDAVAMLGEIATALDAGRKEGASGPSGDLVVPSATLRRVEELLRDTRWYEEAERIAGRHAFTMPALMAVLNHARLRAGVLAPAQFAWVKLIDRPLWYALHSLGFESEGLGRYAHPNARVEAAGARDHWATERAAGRPIPWPSIARAIDALKVAHAQRVKAVEI